MIHTLRIEGALTAIAPFHLTHANVAGQVDDNGAPKVLRGGTAKIPCAMTYKVPVRIAGEDGINRSFIPTIPCTSLRGRIRRAAADRIKQRFIDSNQVLDRESYHVLQVLSYGAQGIDRSNVRPADFTRAAQDLYAGVFGGGPGLFPSTLITPDALAVTRETVELGLLPPSAAGLGRLGAPAAWETTFAHPYVRRDDLLQFLDPLAPKVVAQYAETFQTWQESVAANQAVRAGQRKAAAQSSKDRREGKATEAAAPAVKKEGLLGQQALEAVMPGVIFGFELSVRGTAAQCGMIVTAVQDMLAAEKGMGGFVRNGYGRFSAQLTMKLDGEPSQLLVADGRGSVELVSPAATSLCAAYQAELANYTADQFKAAYLLLEGGAAG